jgi:hypothetical protein
MSVDMRGLAVFKAFRKSKELVVEFCDRCQSICDAACRRRQLRERTLDKALRVGARIA